MLRWIGQVGTGFTDKMLAKVMELLTPLVTKEPPTEDPDLKEFKGATFVRPEIVCEVEYLELTKSTKKMRAPSFKGLRTDKAPEDCILEPPAVIRASGTRSAG
jgi:ATP-dependent DNA ligase